MASTVTMKDVAQVAGVTQQAVSLVFTGKGRISDATREKVYSAAAKLGYRLNTSARAVKSGRFSAIALLFSVHKNASALQTRALEGIHAGLDQRDLQLVVGRLPDTKLTSAGYVPKLLREWSVDGLLINYTDHIPKRLLELVHQHRVPSVWLNCRLETDCIHVDDLSAGRTATEHLLQLGHERIVYLDQMHERASLGEQHYSARDRASGYRAAMKKAGLRPRLLYQEDLADHGGIIASLADMLQAPDRPTAVVCYSVQVSHALIAAAAACGLSIPGDLSFANISHLTDDDAIGRRPTTALLDVHRLGSEAVAMLTEKIEHPKSAMEPRTVPGSLYVGDSTAPPSTNKTKHQP